MRTGYTKTAKHRRFSMPPATISACRLPNPYAHIRDTPLTTIHLSSSTFVLRGVGVHQGTCPCTNQNVHVGMNWDAGMFDMLVSGRSILLGWITSWSEDYRTKNHCFAFDKWGNVVLHDKHFGRISLILVLHHLHLVFGCTWLVRMRWNSGVASCIFQVSIRRAWRRQSNLYWRTGGFVLGRLTEFIVVKHLHIQSVCPSFTSLYHCILFLFPGSIVAIDSSSMKTMKTWCHGCSSWPWHAWHSLYVSTMINIAMYHIYLTRVKCNDGLYSWSFSLRIVTLVAYLLAYCPRQNHVCQRSLDATVM